MRFKFCGNIDCPDWLITEITYLTKFTSVKLRIISNQICKFIINKGSNIQDLKKILDEMNLNEQESKIVISVLDFIFRNSAKFDVEDIALNQELQQLGLPQENAESISKVFKNQKLKLREFLKNDIFSFNIINDVNFKNSYTLSDNYTNFNYVNEKESELSEDNYNIQSLEKTRINLCFNIQNNKNYVISMDKDSLGKLIQDLEKCSEVIKKYKEG
jgi:hydroxymethylpyrimidine pyrophosphatase-like HAD family hydrolase